MKKITFFTFILFLCETFPVNGQYITSPDKERNYIRFTNGKIVTSGNIRYKNPYQGEPHLLHDNNKIELKNVYAFNIAQGFYRRYEKFPLNTSRNTIPDFYQRTLNGDSIDVYSEALNYYNHQVHDALMLLKRFSSSVETELALPVYRKSVASSNSSKYFTLGHSEMKGIRYRNLIDVMRDHKPSKKHLHKARFNQVLKGATYFAGGSLLLSGLLIASDEEWLETGLAISVVGGGSLFLPRLFNKPINKNYLNAIEAFNKKK